MTFTNDASNAEELESDLTDMVVILLSFESNHYTVREGESIVIALQTSAGTPNIITVPTSLVHSYGNEKYFTLTPFTDLPLVNFGPRATRHEFTFVAHDDDVYTANKGNFGILLIKDDFQNPPVTALPDYFRLSDGVSNHDQRVIIAYVTITEDELDPDANNAATGQPSISGTAQVGQILTVEIGTIADADGVPAESEFSYQWLSEDAGVETETHRGHLQDLPRPILPGRQETQSYGLVSPTMSDTKNLSPARRRRRYCRKCLARCKTSRPQPATRRLQTLLGCPPTSGGAADKLPVSPERR